MTEEQLWLFDPAVYEPKPDYSGVPHYEHPNTDNERLMEWQYQYKVKGNQKALSDMFLLGFKIAKKMTNQECMKQKRFRTLSKASREEKAADAANYLVMAVQNKKGWYVTDSFTGYLHLRVIHELKYHRKVDDIVDFVDIKAFYKSCDEHEYGVEKDGGEEWN